MDMKIGFDRTGGLLAAYCLAAAITVVSLVHMARGQEPLPTPPGPPLHDELIEGRSLGPIDPATSQLVDRVTRALAAEFGNGLVFRVTMPHTGPLLQYDCNSPSCCEEMLERIGVGPDRHFGHPLRAAEIHVHVGGEAMFPRQAMVLSRVRVQAGQIIDTRPVQREERRVTNDESRQNEATEYAPEYAARFIRFGCPVAEAGPCLSAAQATCDSQCAAAGCVGCKCENCECEECHCTSCGGKSNEPVCGEECVAAGLVVNHMQHLATIADHHPLKLMQHIAGLMAEKAAAEAALEVRRETAEQLSELFEAMAEVMADNAALDARLEAQAEHTKLVEKMGELAAENARLKSKIELAAEREELSKATLTLTLENERLKLRLADLEATHASDDVRTAAKPHGERKAH
jgi:hypothetical protein